MDRSAGATLLLRAAPDEHIKIYLGPLGPLSGNASVWAECVFIDPIMDIAVLSEPNENLRTEADDYEELLGSVEYLPIADAPLSGRVQVLSLDDRWVHRRIMYLIGGWFELESTEGSIVGRMSGTPILSMQGAAVAVLSVGPGSGAQIQTTSLTWALPKRLLACMVRHPSGSQGGSQGVNPTR